MFSVIIPTIWAPKIEITDKLIVDLSQSSLINEIILINNAPTIYSDRYSHINKVREIKYDNIYVNASWNIGVYQSNSDFICICGDDVNFNTNIFDFMKDQLKRSDVKIVGVSKSSYIINKDSEYSLEKVNIRNKGWGCIIFMDKKNYVWIPNDLKIYFGDDYLIKQLSGFVWKVNGFSIKSEIATSVLSDPNFDKIIQLDTQNSLKYDLPWSGDY